MRKNLVGVFVIAGLLVSVSSARLLGRAAVASRAETTSVTGELVSIMCVKGNGDKGRGEAHVECAVRCAKDGYELAVLTTDGTMYKLTGALTADHNAALQKLLAKNVVATGEQTEDAEGKVLNASTVVLAR